MEMKLILCFSILVLLSGCECVKEKCNIVKSVEYKVYQQDGAFKHDPEIYTFLTYENGSTNIYKYKKEIGVGEKDCKCLEWK